MGVTVGKTLIIGSSVRVGVGLFGMSVAIGVHRSTTTKPVGEAVTCAFGWNTTSSGGNKKYCILERHSMIRQSTRSFTPGMLYSNSGNTNKKDRMKKRCFRFIKRQNVDCPFWIEKLISAKKLPFQNGSCAAFRNAAHDVRRRRFLAVCELLPKV